MTNFTPVELCALPGEQNRANLDDRPASSGSSLVKSDEEEEEGLGEVGSELGAAVTAHGEGR